MRKRSISEYTRNIADAFPGSKLLSDNQVLIKTDSISLYIQLLNTDKDEIIMNIETSIAPFNFQGLRILESYTSKNIFMDVENVSMIKHYLNTTANLTIHCFVDNTFNEDVFKLFMDLIPLEYDEVFGFIDTILRSDVFQKELELGGIFSDIFDYDTYDDYGIDITSDLHFDDEHCFQELNDIEWLENL